MKFTLLSAWATLALAGGIYAAPPAAATASVVPVPPAVPAPPAVPSRLAATGRVQPIGSQIQLSWLPAPRTQAYKVYRDGQFLALSSRAFWADYGVAAGETHSYTVASLISARESRPSTPASATVPAGGGSVVYADKLENGWQSWSWAATDLASASPVRSGSAIRVAAGPWQALYLHHAPFSASAYTAVTFWVHGGSTGGQKLCVKALRSGVPQAAVSLDPLPAGKWQSVTISLRDLGVAGVPDLDGLWVQDASGTTQPAFSVDEIALTAAPALAPPAAPAGLSATPQWEASCAECGGMAMAHIVLAWNAVAGASSYTVYRYGAKVQDGLTAPNWTDMDATSGKTYAYTVSATGPGGEGPQSVSAAATAPNPPSSGTLGTPFNVTVNAAWTGALTQYGSAISNMLTWSLAPGAVSYNVYESDVLVAHGLRVPAFTITSDIIQGNALYTVTAVDGTGMESIPSAPAGYQAAYDPASIPAFVNSVPWTPDTLSATPDWNLGKPRVVLTWRGRMGAKSYDVYRDGVKVGNCIWRPYFLDVNVLPGETHQYAVTSVNSDWTPYIESPLSQPVSITTLSGPPSPTGSKVTITKIVPNDDSAVVFFTPVHGVADYRIYDIRNPAKVKYAGQITQQQTAAGFVPRMALSIEWNGIDPTSGADLVVEAVDKLGPFQKMDGDAGDVAMNMDGMTSVAINGQGDPSNVPNVLAQSDTFHVSCVPVSLTGQQAFFDNFRNSAPFVKQPIPAPVDGGQYYGDPGDYAVYANDKWEIRQYGADLVNSKISATGNHFMDTTYDGGGIGSPNPAHNNVASMVMMPKATADLSGGKVLHVTFEVDAHMDGRRWCELIIGEAGDTLIDCAKFSEFERKPTVSGKLLRWQIQSEVHSLQAFLGDGNFRGVDLIQPTDGADIQTTARMMWDHKGPYANGTSQDLDKRHRFDLFLSKTHYRLQETAPDGLYNVVREKDFPVGVSLPFDKCQVYFVHQVYHTANDIAELTEWYPFESYWYTQRPYADERHWDNMGFEVLTAFPK